MIGYAYTLGESLLREGMTDKQITECRARLLKAQSSVFGSGAQARRKQTA
jgi:hypothetical protein